MWPGFRDSPTRRWLPWALLLSFVGPWALGEFVKTFHQPGLDDDSARRQMMIDFIVAGSVLSLLTMLVVVLLGCWITAVLRGPRRDGDAFPADHGRPGSDN
jgi:hypothetical protein